MKDVLIVSNLQLCSVGIIFFGFGGNEGREGKWKLETRLSEYKISFPHIIVYYIDSFCYIYIYPFHFLSKPKK